MSIETESGDYFRDLYELGSNRSLSIDEKIEEAITIGRDRLGLSYGVLSYTADGKYEVVGSTIETGDYSAGSVHELDETWCRHVVDDREMLVVADADSSGYAGDIARSTTGLQCYIGAPILVDGEAYGTLCYSDTSPRGAGFGEQEQQFVELLTQWISYEIERQKHYQTVEAQNERLNEFAGVLAHDIRNPLTVAKLRLELAQKEFGSEDLNAVQDAHDRMETMIGDLLTLAKTGETIDATERFSFADIARDAWKNADVGDCEFETSIPETVDIVADRDRLLHVFENLYRNAADHNETTVTVRVGLLNEHEPATDWSQQPGFFIEDSGHGIPLKQQANIFEEGYTTSSTGSGYGLSIVHDIVEAHGGDIRVSNGPGGGARFEVTGFKLTTE